MDILKQLCSLNGISGDESDVRNFILEEIKPYCTGKTDKLGNILAFKKGRKTPALKTVFEAHMDETGYMISGINSDGMLKIVSVGVSANVTAGKTVSVRGTADGTEWLDGVLGIVPVHLTEKEELGNVPKLDGMYVDIGAKDEADARKHVTEGDCVYFKSDYGSLGHLLKGKAFDDRAGCFNLIRMIKSDLEYDAYFAFCVQEEVGLRGAVAAANALKPGLAVIIEGTTAADIGGVEPEGCVCALGGGAAVSFADRGTIYDPELVAAVMETARRNGIPHQFKAFVSGGCDAASWQRASGGAKVITLSVPTRYLHSRISVVDPADVESVFLLAKKINEEISGNGVGEI